MQYFSSLLMIFATIALLFFSYATQQYFTHFKTHWLSIIVGSIFLILAVIAEARRQKEVRDEEKEWRKKD